MNCDLASRSLKAIEAEHDAARFALAGVLRRIREDPSLLTESGVTVKDIERAARNIEATFSVRLFARFEGIVREYWATLRPSEPKISVLLDRVASRVRMPAGLLDHAHEVREYRNRLIHEGDGTPILSLTEVRGRLCRFVSHLPRTEW